MRPAGKFNTSFGKSVSSIIRGNSKPYENLKYLNEPEA